MQRGRQSVPGFAVLLAVVIERRRRARHDGGGGRSRTRAASRSSRPRRAGTARSTPAGRRALRRPTRSRRPARFRATSCATTSTLNVDIDPSHWESNNGGVEVLIAWADETDDFDLYVYDAAGNVVGSSANARHHERARLHRRRQRRLPGARRAVGRDRLRLRRRRPAREPRAGGRRRPAGAALEQGVPRTAWRARSRARTSSSRASCRSSTHRRRQPERHLGLDRSRRPGASTRSSARRTAPRSSTSPTRARRSTSATCPSAPAGARRSSTSGATSRSTRTTPSSSARSPSTACRSSTCTRLRGDDRAADLDRERALLVRARRHGQLPAAARRASSTRPTTRTTSRSTRRAGSRTPSARTRAAAAGRT